MSITNYFLSFTFVVILLTGFLPLDNLLQYASADTFGYTAGTYKRVYSSLLTAGQDCNQATVGGSDTNTQGIVRTTSTDSTRCQTYTVRSDISSLPTNISVSSVIFKYNVTAVSNPDSCDYFALENDPTTASDAVLYVDVRNGTNYANDHAGCSTAGPEKVITFSSDANTDIQTKRLSSVDWWAFAITGSNWENTGGVQEKTFDVAKFEIQITYTEVPPPNSITNLSNSTAPTLSTIGLNWTTPSAGGGNQNIIGYQLNVTTPQTNNPLVFVNDTGTTITNYNVTGLTSDTAYSARVSAWTNNTDGHPFNNATGNVFNFTTNAPTIGNSTYLDDLGDVVLTVPSQFSVLFYNGINWMNQVFKSNSLTCGAGLFFSGYDNQTGDYTCSTPPSGSIEKSFVLVATADLNKQKNNLGTTYTDIYNDVFEPDFNLINFTGYSEARILSGWDYSNADTGNQSMRWVDTNNNTQVLYETSLFTIDQDPNDSGWIILPTWAKNETTIEWQGKSTISADDPIAKYFRIFLK